MEGRDGFEICRLVRQAQPLSAIILSSKYEPHADPAAKAVAAGADSYLVKPFKQGQLILALHSALRVVELNHALLEKNRQLGNTLVQLRAFQKDLTGLNEELDSRQKKVGMSMQEILQLNEKLDENKFKISSMNDELSRRFDSTESLLVSIIEIHQSDHRGHAERVARLSVAVARTMVLDEHRVDVIRTAARLHELGIVALPTQERKSQALDEGKNRRYNNHPVVGEMLLKSFPGFEMVADIVRHLHENVDGTGTPDGLVGKQIPLGARIISAASYFDHSRVSNPDRTPENIMEQMLGLAGGVFDQEVLGVLQQTIETEVVGATKESRECSVFTLSEGMELAADMVSESGINLLRKGTVLDLEIVGKVQKFHNTDPIIGPIKITLPS
jgi:response regulator RpfG family c-di-GMP phosphodiesterase